MEFQGNLKLNTTLFVHLLVHRIEKKLQKLHKPLVMIVIPTRIELITYCLEGSCSIQLSYGTGKFKCQFQFQCQCDHTYSNTGTDTINVGVARFELATSWSQTMRDDRTTLHPVSYCSLTLLLTLTSSFIVLTPSPTTDNFDSVLSFSFSASEQQSAVREGFEPSVQFPVRQFSKLFLSATQAPHPIARPAKIERYLFLQKK